MEQRGWGILLIAVALLGVFVTANLRPHPVVGLATAEPVPGPPEVGDCVLEPVPGLGRLQFEGPEGSLINPTVTFGVCHGPRYGEVAHMSLGDDQEADAAGAESFDQDAGQAAVDRCWAAGRTFIGAPAGGTHLSELYWSPAVAADTVLVGPDDRQRANGQRWSACITLPRNISDGGLTEPYQGTLRDALRTGIERDHLGLCLEDGTALEFVQTCRELHRAQIIAMGVSGGAATARELLQESCRARVEHWVGARFADETTLRTRLTVIDSAGAERNDALIPPNSGLTCLVEVVGDRSLVGSILGLGDDPIPWG